MKAEEEAYATLADEMNDGDVVWVATDWDENTVLRGATYAGRHGLAWPPQCGDFDRYWEQRHAGA